MSFAPIFSIPNFVIETINVPKGEVNMSIFLKEVLEEHARMINRKDTAQYEPVEVPVNQTFPGADNQSKRFIFRKIVDTGALPDGTAPTQTAHGITGIDDNWLFTRIYGSARQPVATPPLLFIPLPNGAPDLQVQLSVDVTFVNIETVNDLSDFTSSQVILEFYKV